MNNRTSILVNLEYCGHCNGTCAGCLMTPTERSKNSPFLSYEQVLVAYDHILSTSGAINYDFAALAFGRGNTLSLSDEDWETMFKLANQFLVRFTPKDHVIEFSTGLIGKIDSIIETAKRRVEQSGNKARFVVVANSDLFSKSYWENVSKFFEEMMAFRGGREHEESGDVLVLNLVSDRLPPVEHVLSQIKDYPFPVNIAWLPSSTGDNSQSATWLSTFSEKISKGRWDCNLISLSKEVIKLNPTLVEAIEYQRDSQSWWVGADGVARKGLFTPLGDIDFERWKQKLGVNISSNPSNVRKEFTNLPSCIKCKWQNECLASGTAFHALASVKSNTCPTGMSGVFGLCEKLIQKRT